MANLNQKNPNLSIENLEDRRLMAASIDLYGSQLQLHGDSQNDYMYVQQVGNQIKAVVMPNMSYSQQITKWYDVNDVSKVYMDGHAGKDTMLNYTNIESKILGGDGNDYIYGGNSDDTLMGLRGSDTILGNGGDDWVQADIISVREYRQDYDRVYGGTGNDTIYAQGGDDRIYGDDGNDYISVGSGNKTVFGGSGNDTINTSSGNDTIFGGSGNDVISGGSGNDLLYGESGMDTLYGRYGNDYLDGGDDGVVDQLYGGAGMDTFVSNGGWTYSLGTYHWHSDSINDYSAADDTVQGTWIHFTSSPYMLRL